MEEENKTKFHTKTEDKPETGQGSQKIFRQNTSNSHYEQHEHHTDVS